jgi:hypothetical protein
MAIHDSRLPVIIGADRIHERLNVPKLNEMRNLVKIQT